VKKLLANANNERQERKYPQAAMALLGVTCFGSSAAFAFLDWHERR
jgi:hypothetical protein